jgi:hypothetical protein
MSSSWLAEIRRRNVHRVLLAYLAGSWLIAQVSELLSDAFGWPAWALRATVVLLLAGLPAALIVSPYCRSSRCWQRAATRRSSWGWPTR